MLQIGDKYYGYSKEGLDIFRIHKINKDIITISRGLNKTRVDVDYLKDYTKLNPDGFIFFNVVNMGYSEKEGKDVIVMLYRRKDLDNNNSIPFAVCRQNVYDTYTNQLNNTNKHYLGVSMCIENVPKGVSYESMLSCNGVLYSEKISIYIDDSIDVILSMISNIHEFNNVLYKLYKDLKGSDFVGISKSLHSLLTNNYFEYDFKRAFNIIQIDFILKTIGTEIIPEQRILLEDFLKVEIFRTYVLRYSKEIDLSKIKRDYILISDKLNRLYIFAYDKGNYLNRYYKNQIREKMDMNFMLKLLSKSKL